LFTGKVAPNENFQASEGLPLITNLVNQTVELGAEGTRLQAFSTEHLVFAAIHGDLPNVLDFEKLLNVGWRRLNAQVQVNEVRIEHQVNFTILDLTPDWLLHGWVFVLNEFNIRNLVYLRVQHGQGLLR